MRSKFIVTMRKKSQQQGCSSVGLRAGMMGANKCQQGFSLITAIFLLVVIVSLSSLMVTFWAAQQQGSALDVLGARATQASRAGIEWGVFQITQSQVVAPAGQFATDCQGGTSSVPAVSTTQPDVSGTIFSPFYTLVVSCFATSHMEGTSSIWAYNLTATASGVDGATPGSPNYVERESRTTIWQ